MADHMPPGNGGFFWSAQIECDPLSPASRVNGSIVNLEASHPKGLVTRKAAYPVSDLDLCAQCGTGDDDAVPLKHKDPVHGKTEITARGLPLGILECLENLILQLR